MKIAEAKQVRECLYKAIFASLFANRAVQDNIECCFWCYTDNGTLYCDKEQVLNLIDEENILSQEVKLKIGEYIDCYISNVAFFNTCIKKYLKEDFTIEKLAKSDLSIIYTGLTEIVANSELSEKIIVNEMVELAKKYSGENAYKFINGIMRNLVKEFRNEWSNLYSKSS